MTAPRGDDELRPTTIEPFPGGAAGSVMIAQGNTRVLCTASLAADVPGWLVDRETGVAKRGWVTAEYAMLPGSTPTRKARGPDSRGTEIKRMIGRALRGVVDRRMLGERTVWVDCDVIQADGGTRTASITGGYVALCLALAKLRKKRNLKGPPLNGMLAAVSVGVVEGRPMLDLDYVEDSAAEVDMNVVRTEDGRYIELQGTAESTPFPREKLDQMLALADVGVERLIGLQREVLGDGLESLLIR